MRILAIFALLLPYFSFSQRVASGFVFDSQTKSPLPFVNIGVPGKNLGTVSHRNGTYDLANLKRDQNLKFSMVGYTCKEYLVSQIPDTVFLQPQNIQLKEVVVRSKKLKKGYIGNRTSSKLIYGGYDRDFLGAEAGVPMRSKAEQTFINTFHFFISFNDYDSLRFRVNIYNLNGDSVGERILHENVIVENADVGWNNVNLEPFNVVANGDFLVSLEWLTDFPCGLTEIDDNGNTVEVCRLMFSATLFKKHIFYRATSQAEFLKFTGGSLGFLVGVEN